MRAKVEAGFGFGKGAAGHHIVDFGGVEAGGLRRHGADHMREHVVRRVVRNMPRGALPMGVRVAATM